MKKIKLAILFGGCSEEHPVSVKSAGEVAKHLDPDRYDPVFIGITKKGAWRRCDRPGPLWEARAGEEAVLSPDRTAHGLLCRKNGAWETVYLDAVFPVLHGKNGEDGAMQGLLELSGVPYVGCGVAASALAMDKALAYLAAEAAGVIVPRHWTAETLREVNPSKLPFPVFVKPARSGSSFGVSRVEGIEGMETAWQEARRFDRKVLIEEAVVGREVGCAVLGDDEGLTVGALDEIRLDHGFFRIHQEQAPEQGSENALVISPAPLPEETRARVEETAKRVFRALGCRGLARVDLFLRPDGTVVLNEVNTLPGLTSYSRYPRMMAAAGLSMGELIDRLVAMAMKG